MADVSIENIITSKWPEEGLVRLKDVIGRGNPIPVSASSWYLGRSRGLYPAGVRISKRVVAYDVADLRAFLERKKAEVAK